MPEKCPVGDFCKNGPIKKSSPRQSFSSTLAPLTEGTVHVTAEALHVALWSKDGALSIHRLLTSSTDGVWDPSLRQCLEEHIGYFMTLDAEAGVARALPLPLAAHHLIWVMIGFAQVWGFSWQPGFSVLNPEVDYPSPACCSRAPVARGACSQQRLASATDSSTKDWQPLSLCRGSSDASL